MKFQMPTNPEEFKAEHRKHFRDCCGDDLWFWLENKELEVFGCTAENRYKNGKGQLNLKEPCEIDIMNEPYP